MSNRILVPVILLALCTSAFAQNYYYGGYASSGAWNNPTPMPDHSQHAFERSITGSYSATMAQGERPAWDIIKPAEEKPLGDVAREYRAEHAKAKKAQVVWNK